MLQLGWGSLPHMRRQVEGLFEYLQMADLTPGLEKLFLRAKPGENGKAQFVKSEPIMDIEEDGNFTVTPPERPASTPPERLVERTRFEEDRGDIIIRLFTSYELPY